MSARCATSIVFRHSIPLRAEWNSIQRPADMPEWKDVLKFRIKGSLRKLLSDVWDKGRFINMERIVVSCVIGYLPPIVQKHTPVLVWRHFLHFPPRNPPAFDVLFRQKGTRLLKTIFSFCCNLFIYLFSLLLSISH